MKKLKFVLVIISFCITQVFYAQNKPTLLNLPPPSTSTFSYFPLTYGNDLHVNSIKTWVTKAPIKNESTVLSSLPSSVSLVTQFIDGLGRELQTVSYQQSPNFKDVVLPKDYDEIGRQVYTYLPYVQAFGSNQSDGAFKSNPFADQSTYYNSPTYNQNPSLNGEFYYYGKTVFESSPLNRIQKSMNSGNSWVGSEGSSNEKSTKLFYNLNSTADGIPKWEIGFSSNFNNNIPTSNSSYPQGELFKITQIDENGNEEITFKNKENEIIAIRTKVGNTGIVDKDWISIYYIYDDLGLLRFVIPPKAIAALRANNTLNLLNAAFSSNSIVDELCYRYEYDSQNRLIAKKVPGNGWLYMIYDHRDRLVYTQDENMRGKSTPWWMYTLYDELNRPLQTGILESNQNRTQLQDYVNSNTGSGIITKIQGTSNLISNPPDLVYNLRTPQISAYRASNSITFQSGFESSSSDQFDAEIVGSTGLTNTSTIAVLDNPIPAGYSTMPLTKTFYDDYTSTSKAYAPVSSTNLDPGIGTFPETLPITANTNPKGMITSTQVRVLTNPNNPVNDKWLENAIFYDNKGRAIQSNTDNYKGGNDVTTTLYDFSGMVLSSYSVHNNVTSGITNFGIRTSMEYDHAGRLLSIKKRINGNEDRTIVRNTYNGLGQLINKKIGQKRNLGSTPQFGNNPVEEDDYSYNIHGWLKGVNWNYQTTGTSATTNINNNKWFGYDLSYDWGFNQNQFNGNIAGQRWKSAGDLQERSYGYAYDNADRLLKADFSQNNGSASSPVWNNSLTPNSGGLIDFSIKMGDGLDCTLAYDANGNILQMQQMGMHSFNNSQLIDNLNYNYYSNSNKLKSIKDNANNPNSKLGDFKYKSGVDKNPVVLPVVPPIYVYPTDYIYDANGNLSIDANKDITSISYNHLDLPYQITFMGKGVITFIYDANGNKLEKIVNDHTSPNTTTSNTTTYLGAFVYNNNSLEFIGHEEGKIRYIPPGTPTGTPPTSTSPMYYFDYTLKDHLGNVRAVLTDEVQQQIYPAATLETGATATESQFYDIVPANITPPPASLTNNYPNNNGIYNNNPSSNQTANSQQMYKLNGATGVKTGLGITLKVMAGDEVNIFGKSYWQDFGVPANNSHILTSTAISSLLNVFTSGSAITSGFHSGTSITSSILANNNATTVGLTNFINNTPAPSGNAPKAFINWVLFDEHFTFVTGSAAPVDAGNILKSYMLNASITKNGYLYVYCSNESNKDVFFDNLQLVHTKGALLEETHYYPFGLTMSEICSKAANAANNRFKFTGKEEQRSEFNDGSGMELLDYGARMYDNQIGRWINIDPLSEVSRKWSTFTSSYNNPIRFLDPDGMQAVDNRNNGNQPPDRGGILDAYTSHLKQQLQEFTRRKLSEEEQQKAMLGAWLAEQAHKADPYVEGINKTINVIKDVAGSFVPGKDSYDAAKKGNYFEAALYGVVDVFGGSIEKGAAKAVEKVASIALKHGDEAVDLAAKGGGKTMGLGLHDDLSLHRGTGAITYKDAGWQQAGLTKVDWGRASFDDGYFKESFREAAGNAGAIRFDVTSFNPNYHNPKMTNYEFNYILSNPSLYQKTTFIQNGGQVIWDGTKFVK